VGHLRTLGSIVAIVIVAHCAPRWERFGINHVQAEHARQSEYELLIEERFDDQRFELYLNSRSDRQLCIQQDVWPNSLGQLHFAGGQVYVTIDGTRYPIRDRNLGYCVPTEEYGCYHVIPPGGKLSGFIAFSEFDPEVAANRSATRQLKFVVPAPVVCP
jgi:hypothetical protein